MVSELRIMLDKSVVRGMSNVQADALDRYFFQVVPPILINEILADLTKEAEKPEIVKMISGQSYRISGNRGITEDYHTVLAHSLIGHEVPMDGRFLPAGERTARSETGSVGTMIETNLEDRTILRWERREFTEGERQRARRFRSFAQRPLTPMMYLNKIKEAGFDFERPKDDGELVEAVDSLLRERKLQARLFPLLSREHSIPLPSQKLVLDRWDKEGRPMFEVFAPYAFFCLRANFIWSLSLVNLDRPDKNDRKDLEYIYYLPRCEMFGSGDEKHQRLVPFLLRDDQTFVDGNELKEDLKRLSEKWEALSQEERIRAASQRRSAPPEDANSLIFRLWKKHRNQINKSIPLQVLDAQAVDSSQPSEEESQMSFGEFIRMKGKQLEASKELSSEELKTLRDGKTDPPTWAMRKTMMSKERILKRYPWLTADDLEKSNFD